MLLALDAILGQISAHSLATGPVTVEPKNKTSLLKFMLFRVHKH